MAPFNAAAELPSKAALLDFIARYEAPGGYDQAHAAVPETPPRPLTAMSIREVLAWQKHIRPRAVSTAAGRYQIIRDTLTRLVKTYRIDPEQRFDPAMQDRLGQLLLDECGYGIHQKYAFANCLARTWAALPLVSGPFAGRSAWHGTAGNRALVSRADFLAFLEGDDRKSQNSGMSLVAVDLPRATIRYRAVRGAIERKVVEAHQNDTLGESVIVRFAVDPYRTE
ncbi:MAG: hypothetical protein OXF88_25015 [Rhodobacteraceae bacterium]|nr:hypothetical protein [Paracoccaceae bacterium]MCY4141385.1 hypothetical protein [Paracoccaceae bacterium]